MKSVSLEDAETSYGQAGRNPRKKNLKWQVIKDNLLKVDVQLKMMAEVKDFQHFKTNQNHCWFSVDHLISLRLEHREYYTFNVVCSSAIHFKSQQSSKESFSFSS